MTFLSAKEKRDIRDRALAGDAQARAFQDQEDAINNILKAIATLQAGSTGPEGPMGPQGPEGPPGVVPSNIVVTGFQLTTSPVAGWVLTSDASGNGSWQASSGGVSGSGSSGRLVKFTGVSSIGDSLLVESGSNINPFTDNATDLGSATKRWADIWARQIDIRNNTLDTLTLTATVISADLDLTVSSPGSLALTATGGGGTLFLTAAGQTFLTTPQVTFFDSAAAALTLDTSRATAGAGVKFDIFGSGAQLGGTDLAGGEVRIHSGISTGTGDSQITFRTPTPGLTGTGDNTYSTKMSIDGAGNIIIGDGSDRVRWDNATTALQIGGTVYGLGPAILITPTLIFSQNNLGNVGVLQLMGEPLVFSNTGGTVFEATADRAIEVFGSTAAVSSSGTGRIRYDSATNKLQISNNGGAYADIGTGGSMSIGGTVSGGTTGSVLFVGAAAALAQDNANFFWDDTNNQLLLGSGSAANPSVSFVGDSDTGSYRTAANEYAISAGGSERIRARLSGTTTQGRIEFSVGTLSAPEYGVYGTGTFLAASATLQRMFRFTATGAGSGTGEQVALLGQMAAGYTGGARTLGVWGLNSTAGTAGSVAGDWSNSGGIVGQIAVIGRSDGAGTGFNAAVVGDAQNNTDKNFGLYGRALGGGASTWAIGLIGIGHGVGASDVRLGGYFSAAPSTNFPTIASTTRAAILMDNEGTGFPLILGHDSGTVKFRVESSGITRIRADGSAAAPILTFGSTDDPTTGIFHPAANIIGVATNGTEALRIIATGEIGIGGITPLANQMVDVERNTNAEVMIQITNTTSGTAAATTLQIVGNDAGAGTKALRVMEVSPGNTNAGFSFAAGHSLIQANNVTGHNLYLNASNSSGNIIFVAGGNVESGRFTSTGEFGVGATPASNVMVQATRTTNSNVSIGVTNAQSGTAGAASLSATSNAGAIAVTAYSSAYTTLESSIASAGRIESSSGLTAGLVLSVRATNAPILFYSNQSGTGTEKARMFGTGNWSFGGTTDLAQVVVDNGATAESIFIARDNGTTVFTIADGGAVSTISGSAAAPAIGVGGTTTGLFHVATNILGFAVNSTEAMRITATGEIGIGNVITPASNVMVQATRSVNSGLSIGVTNSQVGTAAASSFITSSDAGALVMTAFSSGYTTSEAAIASAARIQSSNGLTGGLVITTRASGAPILFYSNTGGVETEKARMFGTSGNWTFGGTSDQGQVTIDNGATAESILVLRDNATTVWTLTDGGRVTHAPGTLTTGQNAHSLTVTMPNSAVAETGVLYTVTGSGNTTGIQTAAQFTLGAGTGTPTASLAVGGSTAMAGTGTDPFASTAPANFGGFYTASGTTAGSNVGLLGRAFNSTGKNYGLIGYAQAASAVTAIGVTGFTFGNLGTQVGGLFALGSARTNAAVTPSVSAAIIADNGDTTSPIMLLRDGNTTVWTVADGGNMTMNGDFDLVPGTDNQGEIGTDALRWNRVRANNVVTGDLDLKDDVKGAHWKIIEEVDSITVLNVKTGKRFKMALTPIEG